MRRSAGTIVVVLLCCRFARAEAGTPVQPFEPQDRVVFVGDSITRGGLFHAYIRLFYATRFPARSVEFFNCGRSGGKIPGATDRLSWDILPHKPNAAVIMFGMNDVGGGYYAQNHTPDQAHEAMRSKCNEMSGQMQSLMDALSAAGCRLTLIGPSIYDDTAKSDKPADVGKNEALGLWTDRVKDIAAKSHCGFVDFHTLMEQLDQAGQAKDPAFTLVGPDRTHPGPVGHFIMAYLFLKSQQMSADVSKVSIDAAAKNAEAENAEVTGVTANSGQIKFAVLEHSLPFPVPAECNAALNLVPFQKDLNQELLRVKNLSQGQYMLRIDGIEIGNYSAKDLEQGINLAELASTPQYVQAVRVQRDDLNRFRTEANHVRAWAWARERVLIPAKIEPDDTPKVEKAMRQFIAKQSDPKDFGRTVCETVLDDIQKKFDPQADIAKSDAAMMADAKPVSHHYELNEAAGK